MPGCCGPGTRPCPRGSRCWTRARCVPGRAATGVPARFPRCQVSSRCARSGRLRPLGARRRPAQPLARPVVHDDDLRFDRVEKSRRAGAVERAVASGLPDADLSQLVDRAGQLHFLFPVEVRQVEERELAVGQQRADHELVLGHVLRLVLRGGAERIRLPPPFSGCAMRRPSRRDDVDLQALDRNSVAGLHDRPLAAADAEVSSRHFWLAGSMKSPRSKQCPIGRSFASATARPRGRRGSG